MDPSPRARRRLWRGGRSSSSSPPRWGGPAEQGQDWGGSHLGPVVEVLSPGLELGYHALHQLQLGLGGLGLVGGGLEGNLQEFNGVLRGTTLESTKVSSC